MGEKVLFEYVAGAERKETPPRIKVRMKVHSPGSVGFDGSMCCGAAGLHLNLHGHVRTRDGTLGRSALRRQLDAFERMYRELYEEEST